MDEPFTVVADGVRLVVKLTPRASRDAIAGPMAGADGQALLHVRIAAPPVDGEANARLIAMLAKALDLGKAGVTIEAGAGARLKRLHLAGDPDVLLERLRVLISRR